MNLLVKRDARFQKILNNSGKMLVIFLQEMFQCIQILAGKTVQNTVVRSCSFIDKNYWS